MKLHLPKVKVPRRFAVPLIVTAVVMLTIAILLPFSTQLSVDQEFSGPTWWKQTLFDLGEGVGLVGALILVLSRTTIPDWPSVDQSITLVAGALFTFLFLLFAFGAHVAYWVMRDFNLSWMWPAVNSLRALTDGPVLLGTYAIVFFILAFFFFSLQLGLRTALFRFAAPFTFAVMMSLALLDLREMPLHVTNLTAGISAGGFDLTSNWSVLLVSGFLSFFPPPRQDLLLEYEAPLPRADGWWRGEPDLSMAQVCPKCHQRSWLPYQRKIVEEHGQVYSILVYPHPEGRSGLRKCVVKALAVPRDSLGSGARVASP